MRTKPSTLMHFRAVGSGTGRNELGVGTGSSVVAATSVQNQFAASDAPITSAANILGSPANGVNYLHFPTVVAAVGVFVNIPVGTNGYYVNMTQCTLNDIFSGRCTTWDCTAIKALNPNLVVPTGQPITVAIRSDSSGTSQVMSNWLSGTTAACAASELPATNHPFGVIGQSAYGANNGYFYNNAATAVAGAANVPFYVYPQAGTQGVINYVQANTWSLAYVDNGQAIATGLQEVAVLNPSSKYIRSQDATLSLSVPATLPYPDGSTVASPTPSATAWPAVSLFDSSSAAAFPIVTLSYFIVPAGFSAYTNAYDAESVGMLMTLLQYVYYPEVTVGYNYSCGYSASWVPQLAAYSCAAYQVPSILSGFYFATLPVRCYRPPGFPTPLVY